MYVIDASVYIADARPSEQHHTEAKTLLAHITQAEQTVVLPMIVLAEVAAAIARATGRPKLGLRLIQTLKRTTHFQFVTVDDDLGETAATLAATQQIRGCDAIYVALAQRESMTLITLDGEQLKRAPAGVTTRTPADELAHIAQRSQGNPDRSNGS
jgi:predicted nucleic acid-binding protein